MILSPPFIHQRKIQKGGVPLYGTFNKRKKLKIYSHVPTNGKYI